MSARSVNAMNDKVRQLGLPEGSCFRRYKFTSEGYDQYLPHDAEGNTQPLGWFFRTVDDRGNKIREYFLGGDMNEAMEHLDNWSKEHGKEGAPA